MAGESPASSFEFLADGNPILVLNERFLPYRPVRIGGKQRAEFTWYPGSPDAVVQMLGPEENSIQLQGFWKDRFFTDTAVIYTGSAIAGQVRSVADLVQVVDDLRRTGRRLAIRWSSLQRIGHIISFQQTWHNPHDCEWEIEFAVSSQGDYGVGSEAPTPAPADVAAAIQDAADKVVAQTTIATEAEGAGAEANARPAIPPEVAKQQPKLPPKVTWLARAYAALELFNNKILGTANYQLNLAYNQFNRVVGVADATRQTVANIGGLIGGTATALGTVVDKSISEVYSFKFWGDQDSAPFGIQLASNNVRASYGRTVRQVRYASAYQRYQIAQQEAVKAGTVLIYTATADTDLRQVSIQYYKTEGYWRQLMRYNNKFTSRLSAGEQVYVPQSPVFATGGSNG